VPDRVLAQALPDERGGAARERGRAVDQLVDDDSVGASQEKISESVVPTPHSGCIGSDRLERDRSAQAPGVTKLLQTRKCR
jgi:hypothetical protein